ncbi:MAG: D-amino-acid dehydrogenase [Rhodobacteraceae bacterium HLUCCA12]|nr:MAG: D-amino-acid dehydrogenase [Rhodobacteraceae bacterium HLUCCA12]
MGAIAVIGAGVIGRTLALELASDGHEVLLVAPEAEPHMASTGNAAIIADYAIDPVATPQVLRSLPSMLVDPLGPLAIHRPSAPRLTPWLARFAWQCLPANARRNRQALLPLLAGTGADWVALAGRIGAGDLFRRRGALYAFETAQACDAARPGLARSRLHGIDAAMIDAATLEMLEPGLPRGRFGGAVHYPSTLSLDDPAQMLDRIGAAGTARGVLRIDARVSGLRRTRHGWHLTLSGEPPVEVAQIVITAGAWSGQLARLIGCKIPLDTERGYHLEFDLADRAIPLTRPICPERFGFYLTPLSGRLRAAGTVELGGRDSAPSPARWGRIEQGARSILPDLPPVSRRWMGLRPSLPDSLPVIGAAGPGAPGAWLAFGHGHLGLTLAPRTASLLSALIAGRAPPLDPAPYGPARFRAGLAW